MRKGSLRSEEPHHSQREHFDAIVAGSVTKFTTSRSPRSTSPVSGDGREVHALPYFASDARRPMKGRANDHKSRYVRSSSGGVQTSTTRDLLKSMVPTRTPRSHRFGCVPALQAGQIEAGIIGHSINVSDGREVEREVAVSRAHHQEKGRTTTGRYTKD